MRKFNLLVLLLLLILVGGCSNSNVKNNSEITKNTRAIVINDKDNLKVSIPENMSDIVFEMNSVGKLKISVSLEDGDSVKKLLISDGDNIIRINPIRGDFIISGEKYEIFKTMVEENRNIVLKGKISNYNYFTENIDSVDVKVISLIFEEKYKKISI